MMTKSTIHKHITDAKRAHLSWVRKAEHLIEDLPVSEDMIPLDATVCTFGRWLYDDGSRLRMINTIDETLNEVERYHNELHDHYTNIYKIYFVLPKQKSLLSKIMTFNSKKVTKAGREEALIHFKNLKKSSEYLIDALHDLEHELKNLNYTDIDVMHS